MRLSRFTVWIALAITVAALSLAALWLTKGEINWFHRADPPQFAWAEFTRPEGGQPPIRLAGHSAAVLTEEMFAGFRTGWRQATPDEHGVEWRVLITDTDGRQRRLVVRKR